MSFDPVGFLLDQLEQTPHLGRDGLQKLKNQVARRVGGPLLRNDVLLGRYRQQVTLELRSPNPELERTLVLNAIRSDSGVVTVTVLTKPYPCPGRCVYCPTDPHAPKSYLPNEPPTLRAIDNDYDPHRQVTSRLTALRNTGHAVDKVELIVKGGTWSFYPDSYQRRFIQRCFDAANGFPSEDLETAQRQNETAKSRIIGLTIETRPDYVTGPEIERLRELGVTRVELGVQSLEDRILDLTQRDHTTEEVARGTQRLRDAGFKVVYHLMPNLPGATPSEDLNSFQRLFEDPAFRPDALKIYPCVVVESAELYRWWKEGLYRPYEEETLLELILQMKQRVPPYVRIERIVRDIAASSVIAGCRQNNLRETVRKRMSERNLQCRCIRCREVRRGAGGKFLLVRREYEASGRREIFLSFEDPRTDRLAALLRLRILENAGMVRELHTYGWQLPLQERDSSGVQHRGFGRRLMAQAERIARKEVGLNQMAVIAGVGVREYYRRLGYRLEQTYMVKEL